MTDVSVMHKLVEREVLEFLRPGGTKKWVILRDLRQGFLEFFVIQKTEMPLFNVVKGL